jgi:hypothetical protein
LGGRIGIGFADGNSKQSQFNHPTGLALSADEKTLYVCDTFNSRVRAIDTASTITRTVAGSGIANDDDEEGIGTAASLCHPSACDWNRASDVEPFTFLYFLTPLSIRCLNVKSGQVTSLKFGVNIRLSSFVCLPGSGALIISSEATCAIWAIDPHTGAAERLAGALRDDVAAGPSRTTPAVEWDDPHSFPCSHDLSGMVWNERDQSILLADQETAAVFRIPLPDRLFVSPSL